MPRLLSWLKIGNTKREPGKPLRLGKVKQAVITTFTPLLQCPCTHIWATATGGIRITSTVIGQPKPICF